MFKAIAIKRIKDIGFKVVEKKYSNKITIKGLKTYFNSYSTIKEILEISNCNDYIIKRIDNDTITISFLYHANKFF